MDGAKSVFFYEFLSSTSGNHAKCRPQGVTVLQKFLNVARMFSYSANDKWPLGKMTNKAQLEAAQKKANAFNFSGAINLSASVVTAAFIVSRSSC